MGRVRGGGRHPLARVDHLDPETLRRVQSFLNGGLVGRASEPHAERAWDLFYEACAPLIHKLVQRHGLSAVNHDDRVQEVWLCLLVHLSRYDPARGAFSTWLGAVVRNALATLERGNRAPCCLDLNVVRDLPSREADPSVRDEPCQIRRDIEAAVAELRLKVPAVTYRIIYAHWVEQQSFAEIAAILGLPVKQVRDRHHRAIALFRRLLARRI